MHPKIKKLLKIFTKPYIFLFYVIIFSWLLFQTKHVDLESLAQREGHQFVHKPKNYGTPPYGTIGLRAYMNLKSERRITYADLLPFQMFSNVDNGCYYSQCDESDSLRLRYMIYDTDHLGDRIIAPVKTNLICYQNRTRYYYCRYQKNLMCTWQGEWSETRSRTTWSCLFEYDGYCGFMTCYNLELRQKTTVQIEADSEKRCNIAFINGESVDAKCGLLIFKGERNFWVKKRDYVHYDEKDTVYKTLKNSAKFYYEN